MLADNLNNIKERINEAAKRAGRTPEDITLIAVSKTKPVEMISEVYAEGQRDFGENKVQEIVSKEPVLPSDIKWHLIGHLQTNKVKYIADRVEMIHSVDSFKLAEEINKQAVRTGTVVKILVEVNVAGEDSKFGVSVEETEDLIRKISVLPGIIVMGLMTVAPFVDDPEENRTVFSRLRELLVDINSKSIDNVNMVCLSMGMSGDFEVAIEEGATHVRVGTSIFGKRG